MDAAAGYVRELVVSWLGEQSERERGDAGAHAAPCITSVPVTHHHTVAVTQAAVPALLLATTDNARTTAQRAGGYSGKGPLPVTVRWREALSVLHGRLGPVASPLGKGVSRAEGGSQDGRCSQWRAGPWQRALPESV